MTTSTMLRTGNRVLDVTNGLVFEKIGSPNDIVHVYRVQDGPNPNASKHYVKYRYRAARLLWAYVCKHAVDLSETAVG